MVQDTLFDGGVLGKQLDHLLKTGPLSWHRIIESELYSDPKRYAALDNELKLQYAMSSVNPARENIFRAFRDCPAETCKVVILGQDPYPRKEHAMGLAFSVPAGEKLPPTLKNILTELCDDIGPNAMGSSGELSCWAHQGVLLLNTVLTVETGNTNSHRKLWGSFARNVLHVFNQKNPNPVVYILWGNPAGETGKYLESSSPSVYPRKFIYSVHPSPLAAYRGFFGSKPFSETNRFLVEHGEEPIHW